VFLGTGIMVVCLKHVGITDSYRERLKMSVKTLVSWSAHARITHPGNLSLPCSLVNVGLSKGLSHIGYREFDHTVFRYSWCSHACFSVILLKASIEGV
jgi:hypothetical protein